MEEFLLAQQAEIASASRGTTVSIVETRLKANISRAFL